MKNLLLRILFFILATYVFKMQFVDGDLLYPLVYIASVVITMILTVVGKLTIGSEKIYHVRAYIFACLFFLWIVFEQLLGRDVANMIQQGSLFGTVVGLILISKQFWSNDKEEKLD